MSIGVKCVGDYGHDNRHLRAHKMIWETIEKRLPPQENGFVLSIDPFSPDAYLVEHSQALELWEGITCSCSNIKSITGWVDWHSMNQ